MTVPVEVTSVTTGSDMTSSTGVYYQCAVIFIGVVGTAANALILYALVVTKQHKKHVLVFNQNALDLFSCLFLVITYIAKLCKIHPSGSLGYLVCITILRENVLYCGIMGFIISLAVITVERYLKVVHAVWSKNKLRNWMIYSAAAFSWISPVVYITAMNFSTIAEDDCYETIIWKSPMAQVQGIWTSVLIYLTMMLLFVFCYGRILMTVRHRANMMAVHSGRRLSSAEIQSRQIQSNITKTMILVCALYAVTWMPYNILYFLMNLDINSIPFDNGYCSVLFISFFYICANPFIYAAKFDPVRRVLLGLIPGKKTAQNAKESVRCSNTCV